MSASQIQLALAKWLESKQCKCHDVKPVRVTIGEHTWEGCHYKQVGVYTKTMDAVTRGEKKEGDTFIEESMYLIGRIPREYGLPPLPGSSGGVVRRQQRVCFPFQGFDWYVSGYMQGEITRQNQHFNPFGHSWMLRPWNIPNSKVDDGEPKPYTRVEMKVEYV